MKGHDCSLYRLKWKANKGFIWAPGKNKYTALKLSTKVVFGIPSKSYHAQTALDVRKCCVSMHKAPIRRIFLSIQSW